MAITLIEDKMLADYTANMDSFQSFQEYHDYEIQRIREISKDTIYHVDFNGKDSRFEPIDHHPSLKEYEIWMEGYRATGESSPAVLLGRIPARNFAQACHIFVATSFLQQVQKINEPGFKDYCDPGRWDYDSKALSIWGCRLFWNEELARKSFG